MVHLLVSQSLPCYYHHRKKPTFTPRWRVFSEVIGKEAQDLLNLLCPTATFVLTGFCKAQQAVEGLIYLLLFWLNPSLLELLNSLQEILTFFSKESIYRVSEWALPTPANLENRNFITMSCSYLEADTLAESHDQCGKQVFIELLSIGNSVMCRFLLIHSEVDTWL